MLKASARTDLRADAVLRLGCKESLLKDPLIMKGNPKVSNAAQLDPVLERFLRYVHINTQSDEASPDAPSSARQLELAKLLVKELGDLGLKAEIGCGGIVYAEVPATKGCEKAPTIGFIAHMDTSPDAPGAGVSPQIIH